MALTGSGRKELAAWTRGDRAAAERDYGDLGSRMKSRGQAAYDKFGGEGGAQDFIGGELRGIYEGLGSSGGYGGSGTGGLPGKMQPYLSWAQGVGELGASSPEQLEEMKGWGTFKEAADTGLWSDEDKRDFRARGTQGQEAFFGGMASEMARGRQVQGGYGTGYSTSRSQLARDAAAGQESQRLGVETTMASSIRENRKWGALGGADAAQKIFGNMMEGQKMGMSIEQSIAAAKRAARSSAAAGGRALTRDQLMLLDEIGENARATGGDLDYAQEERLGYGQRGAELAGTRESMAGHQQRKDIWDKMEQGTRALKNVGEGIGSVVPG
ncbi:hypothetical protein LCGC14_0478190 [marine sediment metagenome]|uniref:Uncharacterized protein n=1 Tax=marine sediment metagenome TaxID=412755 RepID=A0A0F9SFK0_9ZZZZ